MSQIQVSQHQPVRVILLEDLDAWLVPYQLGAVERQPEPASLIDPAGRLSVVAACRRYAEPEPRGRIILLTARDLYRPNLGCLFGYADPASNVAVVSTSRLGPGASPRRLRDRLANVIAHEIGHLEGLKHCRSPGCVMRAVRSPDAIDARHPETCRRCRQAEGPRGRAVAAMVAAAACLMLFLGLDLAGRLLEPAAERPFSCGPISVSGSPYLLFRGQRVLPDHAGGEQLALPCHAPGAVATLNQLFNELNPPDLEVAPSGDDAAAIRYEGADLFVVHRRDLAGEAPMQVANLWGKALWTLLHGKGRESSSCVACHLHRADEVALSARNGWGK